MASNGEEMNETDKENLSTQFKKGLDNYNGILSSDKPTNCSDMQVHFYLFLSLIYFS